MRLTVCTKQQKIKTRKNNEKITKKKKKRVRTPRLMRVFIVGSTGYFQQVI